MNDIPKFVWVLVAAILMLATLRMPYGYYTFTRIAVCGFSVMIAYFAIVERSFAWATAFVLAGIAFNPVIPIYLNRQTWFWIDLGVAALVLAHLIFARIPPDRSKTV